MSPAGTADTVYNKSLFSRRFKCIKLKPVGKKLEQLLLLYKAANIYRFTESNIQQEHQDLADCPLVYHTML